MHVGLIGERIPKNKEHPVLEAAAEKAEAKQADSKKTTEMMDEAAVAPMTTNNPFGVLAAESMLAEFKVLSCTSASVAKRCTIVANNARGSIG